MTAMRPKELDDAERVPQKRQTVRKATWWERWRLRKHSRLTMCEANGAVLLRQMVSVYQVNQPDGSVSVYARHPIGPFPVPTADVGRVVTIRMETVLHYCGARLLIDRLQPYSLGPINPDSRIEITWPANEVASVR